MPTEQTPTDTAHQRRPWQRWLLLLTVLGVVLLLVLAIVLGLSYAWLYQTAAMPTEADLAEPDPTTIRDQDGEPVERFQPTDLRTHLELDEMPPHVVGAVLAAEDRRFHDHGGFSVPGIARAAMANVTSGERRQGASTVTQQYVSLAVADIGDGYLDKFREVVTASRVDDELGKDQILESYLNQVPMGRTATGIEAGARTYFEVPAEELDLEQSAVLAGMIAAPTAYDPEDNPEAAASRRDFVLSGMAEAGMIERDEADELIGSDLPELRDEPIFSHGPDAYFLDVVRDQAPDLLDDGRDPAMGLEIHTTLDPDAQRLALDELNDQLGQQPYSGAAVTIESDTGAVRALASGLDFEEEQLNMAVDPDGRRQAGSAFKTFGLAELVDQGFDPDETMIDAPEEYDVEVDDGEDTTVRNYSNEGHGEVSAREATEDSINTAYMQLGEELGADGIVDMAGELGIDADLHGFPSVVLGTDDLTVLELTAAYATLSDEGTRHEPFLIERIETHDGDVLYEHEDDEEEVIDPDVANVVTDVLAGVVTDGTGSAAAIDRPVAGKTGTTNEFRDAWFVGYTPGHTTGIWVGNRDNTPMDEVSGGSLPAEIFSGYMSELLTDVPSEDFPDPDTDDLRPLEGLEAPEDEDEDDRPFADLDIPDPDDEGRDPDGDDEDADDDNADGDDDADNGDDD